MENKGRIFQAPVICVMCENTFDNVHDISIHRRQHEFIHLFCTHCSNTFKSAADIAVHRNQKGAHRREVSVEGAEALRKIGSKNTDVNPTELPFLTEAMFDELMHDVAVYQVDACANEVLNELIDYDADDVVDDDAVEGTVNNNEEKEKNDLKKENQLLRERLYKVNAEKCNWERSAKRRRAMVHWTTGLTSEQEIEDDDEKREFRRKLNGTEVVPPDCEHWERVPLKEFFGRTHRYFGFFKDLDKF